MKNLQFLEIRQLFDSLAAVVSPSSALQHLTYDRCKRSYHSPAQYVAWNWP